MKTLILDTEQEAILRQTLTGATAFLQARVKRRDPGGFLSKALALQERKIVNIVFQLDQPPIGGWPDISEDHQAHFIRMLDAFLLAETQHAKAVIYTQIHAFIAAHRGREPLKSVGEQKIKGVAP